MSPSNPRILGPDRLPSTPNPLRRDRRIPSRGVAARLRRTTPPHDELDRRGDGCRNLRDTIGVAVATVTVGVGLIVTLAAFGVDSGYEALHPRHAPAAQDLDMKPSDFQNLHTMTMVRGFFVDNRLGHLKAACTRSAPSSNSCPRKRW
jgi:hypothetical protein